MNSRAQEIPEAQKDSAPQEHSPPSRYSATHSSSVANSSATNSSTFPNSAASICTATDNFDSQTCNSKSNDSKKIVQHLRQQLKDFRLRSPQRSLPAVLADQLALEDAQVNGQDNRLSSQWLSTETEFWNDVSQAGVDWDDQNAIAIEPDSARTENVLTENDSQSDDSIAPALISDAEPNQEDNAVAESSFATEEILADENHDAVPRLFYSTGCPALDQWFPDQGIPSGSIIEVVSSQVGGAATHFSLSLAKTICGDQGLLVVIDRRHDFHAASLVSVGFDLENVLLVRPDNDEDHLWALEQSLGHASVAAVWTRIDMLDGRYQRRWQLAVERSQAVGVLQRPESVLSAPTWAFAQLQISPNPYSSLLTANRSYYQSHPKFRRLVADDFPFGENWIIDLQAVKIRGQFQQPTLRLELHNQVLQDGYAVQQLPVLTQRLTHPNDPAVTKPVARQPFERFDRQVQEVTNDESCSAATGRESSFNQSFRQHREAADSSTNRMRLDPRLANSATGQRTGSA